MLHLPKNPQKACDEHLHDNDAIKTNRIKCPPCNVVYCLDETKFKLNKIIENILSKNDHLNGEEKSLKLKIEQEMSELFQLCYELRENKSLTELECQNHFQEIRTAKIDIRREEAKKKRRNLHRNDRGDQRERSSLHATFGGAN